MPLAFHLAWLGYIQRLCVLGVTLDTSVTTAIFQLAYTCPLAKDMLTILATTTASSTEYFLKIYAGKLSQNEPTQPKWSPLQH